MKILILISSLFLISTIQCLNETCPFTQCKCPSNTSLSYSTNSNGCAVCTCSKTQSENDVCVLPKLVGPCKAKMSRFYFDSESKKCSPFYYGGCKGNENNFLTLEFCKRRCVNNNNNQTSFKHNHPHQKMLKRCSLEKDIGPCRGSIEKYFYNSTSKQCEMFLYGGCEGNHNNFETESECTKTCAENEIKQQTSEVCQQEQVIGPCRAAFKRFFFNTTSKKCEQFVYGGCRGNDNNFMTSETCEKTCLNQEQSAVEAKAPESVSICLQEKKIGKCRAAFKRFYFNKDTNKCEQFIYGGCDANENNFKTKEECESKCLASTQKNFDKKNVCQLEKDVGPCRADLKRFFYNSTSNQCEVFSYGGCQGNENNFETESDCNRACSAETEIKITNLNSNVCELESDSGPCRAAFQRYFYNKTSKACEEFTYGGCMGNENNFETEYDCSKLCQSNGLAQKLIEPSSCNLQADSGPCRAAFKRFYYNSTSQECQEFIYGGCGGNENNFETDLECQKNCLNNKLQILEKPKPDVCKLKKDPGPCKALFVRYYYNPQSKKCEKFNYGGCKGNDNKFVTYSDCVEKCAEVKEDKCKLEAKVGPCMAAFTRYFYNSTSAKCEEFIYGGCQGNQNNFETLQSCNSECGQKVKPGSCPKPGIGICVEKCSSDQDCPGNEKCCSNGCGHVCMKVK